MSEANTYTVRVPEDKARLRLDVFLAGALPAFSRSRLKALIVAGRVAAEGTPGPVTEPAAKTGAGQVYVVTVPAARPAVPQPQAIPIDVVYEDDDLIVIDKPAGLVVHPAPGHPDGTLVNALLAHCPASLSGIGGVTRPGIVHRLDKGTSGLMVVAKNDSTHRHLAGQLEERKLTRAYKALVWGVPKPREGEIAGAIGRNPANRKKMAVVEKGGKPALTWYRVLKAAGAKASLVECRLATGRTHQIRVHMADRGHPVVGDPHYGGGSGQRLKDAPETIRQGLGALNNQALHSYLIEFIHPSSGKVLRFESNDSGEFNELVSLLEEL